MSNSLYIMSARAMFGSTGKANYDKVHAELGSEQHYIIVGQRKNSNKYNANPTPVYISGHGISDVKSGEEIPYTIDSGLGLKDSNDVIVVEKVIQYKGLMVDGTLAEPRKPGRRAVWVMK